MLRRKHWRLLDGDIHLLHTGGNAPSFNIRALILMSSIFPILKSKITLVCITILCGCCLYKGFIRWMIYSFKMRFRDEYERVRSKHPRRETHLEMHLQHSCPTPPPPPGTTDLCLKHQSERAGSARVKHFDQHIGDAASVTPGVC